MRWDPSNRWGVVLSFLTVLCFMVLFVPITLIYVLWSSVVTIWFWAGKTEDVGNKFMRNWFKARDLRKTRLQSPDVTHQSQDQRPS